jgi:6-pyruvoyltetrahydropterin/6-carboxytetrahydropterin synthase
MQVTKRFRFEAAHHLPGYPGKCARPHGHGYRLDVTVEGPVRADGLVFDFYDLKRLVNERVVERLDHRDLNELMPVPSAENIALWIRDQLRAVSFDGAQLLEIRLYETDDAWVTLPRDDL